VLNALNYTEINIFKVHRKVVMVTSESYISSEKPR